MSSIIWILQHGQVSFHLTYLVLAFLLLGMHDVVGIPAFFFAAFVITRATGQVVLFWAQVLTIEGQWNE
jgi:hypothetical protein